MVETIIRLFRNHPFPHGSSTASVRFLTVAVLVAACSASGQLRGADVESVADEIRAAATAPTESASGRPLPLASHWTTGIHRFSSGWAPVHQMELIEQGHHILPWFQLSFDDGAFGRDYMAFRNYFEAAVAKAGKLKLPLVFIDSQWERFLSEPPYLNLPADKNPNVVTPEGQVLRMVSPFGPLEPWRELGRKLTDNRRMRTLQMWYPDPPLVVFLSNNEHARLGWRDVEKSARYLRQYGTGKSADFKRKVIADGYVARYRALQSGMREGLGPSWKTNAVFVGYDAFGPREFARYGGWTDTEWYVPGADDPFAKMWDGGSLIYYTDNWNESTDYRVFSPQIESMNWPFMEKRVRAINPDFWLELSIWDGHEPGKSNDKRAYYAGIGQTYTPERYGGMVQFGMWLLRPRAVREYRSWLQPWPDGAPYFMAIVDAVDRVHRNATLREWWRTGRLVANRAHTHPYRVNVPPEFAREDRWFLLDASVNPRFPWDLLTEIQVFALALVKGVAPEREWLVYAHAPTGARSNVRLTLPDFGPVPVMNVPVKGAFFVVSEKAKTIRQVAEERAPSPPVSAPAAATSVPPEAQVKSTSQ